MGISWLFLFEAYRRIGVSIASLGYYCGPVIVMALAPVMFHEKLTLETFLFHEKPESQKTNLRLSYLILLMLYTLYFRSFIFPAAKDQSH